MNLKIMDHFHEVISFTFELENKDQRYPFLSEAQVLCNLIDVTDSLRTFSLFGHISVVCGSIWTTLRFCQLESY